MATSLAVEIARSTGSWSRLLAEARAVLDSPDAGTLKSTTEFMMTDDEKRHPSFAERMTKMLEQGCARKPVLGKGLEPLLGVEDSSESVAPRKGPTPLEIVSVKRTLHERLRAARVSLGLSEESVAEELGITLSQYAAFESARWPPHHLISPLCRILKICAGELYGTHDRVPDTGRSG